MTNLQEENARMNWYLIESLKKWSLELTPILQSINHNRHWIELPYHTMLINRWLGSSIDDSGRMGAIFKLFMLSDYSHQMIGDDSEGQVYDESLQFNILIGDLLYGCALCLLCENGWERHLSLLTEMIVQINEGHTLALHAAIDTNQVMAREWGSYYRTAFKLAGVVNNLKAEQIHHLDIIGLNLGLATAAEDLAPDSVNLFINKYREDMNWLANTLNTSYDKRFEVWQPDADVKVPAAG